MTIRKTQVNQYTWPSIISQLVKCGGLPFLLLPCNFILLLIFFSDAQCYSLKLCKYKCAIKNPKIKFFLHVPNLHPIWIAACLNNSFKFTRRHYVRVLMCYIIWYFLFLLKHCKRMFAMSLEKEFSWLQKFYLSM